MPIYEYLCNSCGVKKEHIQKMSDTPIKACPECGSENYTKLISAAGFQLKGSGWYVTDFKNKPVTEPAKSKNEVQTQSADSKTDTQTETATANTAATTQAAAHSAKNSNTTPAKAAAD
ncbi:MAG: zinc ribbon domain-containing protein [Nitrosomonas sp.]|nr:zinc ribbon domain-containing protein [Nitrosomonas sp.]